ncbi:Holliday junction branch migration complex subunit RuvB [Candidatus Xenohaliotis californiensis]|uniref:Holliday junction branch migration complex subunit RuvB n=1 Tax=Candidatus Xenohaliotis californiensis TaxID=84677 RepID=A0ABP0EUT1_9RICK|nr:Holliday junction branch migration complex subunit RuvB [Candidatus Xenohaliotis californiensis]
MTERIISKTATLDDNSQNNLHRPKLLKEFTGQSQLKTNLKIFITAAKQRSDALDHIIFYGPAGFGKTTLAGIIAKELGANFKPTAAPLLTRPCDIAAILTNLQCNDVLFIDEMHRLSKNIEEILYPAMENGHLDIMTGKGPAARMVRISIPQFTLIGATTKIGTLSKPLRDRFGICAQFEPYSTQELIFIIHKAIQSMQISIADEAALLIAQCSRGTPRIAIRLAKRLRDFIQTNNQKYANKQVTVEVLQKLGIDDYGLDQYDRRYMKFISLHYLNTPVGINTIAAALSENKENIEETIEPYLIEKGLIHKTARGRILSNNGKKYCISSIL